MIVTRISEEKEGIVELSLAISTDQAQYLLSVGLATLVATGSAVIKDMTRAQFELEQSKKQEEATGPSPAVEVETHEDTSLGHRDGTQSGVGVGLVESEPSS